MRVRRLLVGFVLLGLSCSSPRSSSPPGADAGADAGAVAGADAGAILSLLAGALGGNGNANDTGAAARFYYPNGVATDGTNLFVADTLNYTIRRIVISTGVVTTPIGVAGSAGVVLGPLPARLNSVVGIATSSGQIYLGTENSILMAPAP